MIYSVAKKYTSLIPAFGVFCLFLLIYTFTKNQIFSFDAVTNAIACETNEPIRWFHPNHLLYPSIGVLWYRIENFFGYDGSSLYSLARLNSFFMALGLAILFQALKNEMAGWKSLLSVSLLGFSYAGWHYAVDGRAVGLSPFFGILFIVVFLSLNSNSGFRKSTIYWLALISVLYTLVHGIAILHAPVFFIWLWLKQERKLAFIYLTLVTTALFILYMGIYIFVVRPFGPLPFLDWSLGYAGFGGAAKAGESQFWTYNFISIFSGLRFGWQKSLFHFIIGDQAILRSLSTFIGSLALIGTLLGLFRLIRTNDKNKWAIWFFFAWGLLATIFLAFWSPGQEGFRLHILVPWIAAVALVFKDSKNFYLCLSLFVVGLLTLNLTYSIGYAADIKNNKGLQILKRIESLIQPGDTLVIGQAGAIPHYEVLGPYFFPKLNGGSIAGRLFAFRETSLEPLSLSLQRNIKNGHHVYISNDILDPAVQLEIESLRRLQKDSFLNFLQKFNIHPFAQIDQNLLLLELTLDADKI